jgi:hypothetical protein
MQALSTRTAGFTDSVIRRMTRISNQYGAINLSQGFPDFQPPQAILDRLAQVSGEDFHQYSITWGHRTSGRPWRTSSPTIWAAPSTPTARSWSPAAAPRP